MPNAALSLTLSLRYVVSGGIEGRLEVVTLLLLIQYQRYGSSLEDGGCVCILESFQAFGHSFTKVSWFIYFFLGDSDFVYKVLPGSQ
jgi:hypothetical protein